MKIGKREIGSDQPCYIIAELSANHGHSYARAEQLVRAAAKAGADAVKLQTYTADTMTLNLQCPPFVIEGGTLWDGKTLYELYEEAHMPWEWQPRLAEVAREEGIDLFSSPFDSTAVEFLESFGVPAYKIASFELVDLPLIKLCAETGKPLIMSTGMATKVEIAEAVEAARAGGATDIALLKCTSAYPAPTNAANLATIPALASEFGVVAGLSDHTIGNEVVAVAGRALGAAVIEKHFTLDRGEGGPDAPFSLEPSEFKDMVEAVRTAEAAIGEVRFATGEAESKSRAFRRSLFVCADVKAGDVFSAENVRAIRPDGGLPPKHLTEVLGRTASRALTAGTPLAWEHLV